MPIIEKVAWDFGSDQDIAYRFPKLSLKYGSQVIVKENQWAVFFRDGKAYDVLDLADTQSQARIFLFSQQPFAN